MELYNEPARQIPVTRNADVLVIGAGPAGIAAALASARNGARTVLVERFGFLGGTATAGLMACINGFRNQVEPDFTQVVRGIPEEIVLGLKDLGGLGRSPYPQKTYATTLGQLEYSYVVDTERLKYLTMKLCVEAGVDLMLHTWFATSLVEDGAIHGVIVENKSGRQALMGSVVIDASGDADVAARAGCDFWQVRHDEAPRLNDCLMYRVAFGASRPQKVHGCDFGSHAVFWGPNVTTPINGADGDELTRGEIDTRLRVYEDLDAKRAKQPELADARVIETPALLGVRQTRFVEGEYKLTADDALQGRRFDDVIALSPCAIIHYYGYRRYLEHEGYDIPYRCLLPGKIDNLLVAGRCISSEQQPYESHRAMVNIMAIGQAAGTAAAMAARRGCSPRALDVAALQQTLEAQGAVVKPFDR